MISMIGRAKPLRLPDQRHATRRWLVVQQPTAWQRMGDQINTAFIFAGANFVNVRATLPCQFWCFSVVILSYSFDHSLPPITSGHDSE
jgi:hypothetical protein